MTIALVVSLGVLAIGWLGSLIGLGYVLGVILPYLAALVFLGGVTYKIVNWAKSPVPFAIPTVAGQEKSLDFIKPNRLDAPTSTFAVIGRMALEVLTFRTLFRNTEARESIIDGETRVSYFSSKWLWGFALIFHYCLLVFFIRHFRLFLEPVPICIQAVEWLDGVFQVGVPRMYLTNVLILAALAFLIIRRLTNEKVRYISLSADYLALFLILGCVVSGILMRYFIKVDVAQAKTFIMSLVQLRPLSPSGLGSIFFIHLTFVSTLFLYIPFSKLMHMGGIFLSPTRNMRVDTRANRHVNPWNPPKKYHTYAAYEEDFHEVMAEAGLPLDKEYK